MGDRRGTATVCKFGHEKTGVRIQRGKEVLYCQICNREYRDRHIQKAGPRMKKTCRYGHQLPPPVYGVERRTCPVCADLARRAKEGARV